MPAAAGHILARLALLATLLLAVASYFRFEIVTAGGTVVYRLDRLTGEVSPCVPVTLFQLACDNAAYSQRVK